MLLCSVVFLLTLVLDQLKSSLIYLLMKLLFYLHFSFAYFFNVDPNVLSFSSG